MAGHTIDKLIHAGDGDAALLYLYILKTDGKSTSEDAAAALGKTAGGIAMAMAVLSRIGLVKYDEDTDDQRQDVPIDDPADEPHRSSLEEMKRELREGAAFAAVVEETQHYLGKILSPDELLRLFGIYDALRLPPEVILQLIMYCITESRMSGGGRAPSMRYIERAAYAWEREGIFSLDKAEEHIKILEARRSVRGEIKRILQIKDRELSATESKYVDGWIEMGFDAALVEIAYDKTLIKTGKLVWGYMDTILKSWHNKSIHSAKDMLEKDRKQRGSGAASHKGSADGKFGAPNPEDIERMKRLINKIKDE